MSIGASEKHVLYDNPCAPIVKFSHSNDDDMTDEQATNSSLNQDPSFNPLLGEHSLKSISIEDLVKSFDNTIHDCFSNEETQSNDEESKTPQEDLIASSK